MAYPIDKIRNITTGGPGATEWQKERASAKQEVRHGYAAMHERGGHHGHAGGHLDHHKFHDNVNLRRTETKTMVKQVTSTVYEYVGDEATKKREA